MHGSRCIFYQDKMAISCFHISFLVECFGPCVCIIGSDLKDSLNLFSYFSNDKLSNEQTIRLCRGARKRHRSISFDYSSIHFTQRPNHQCDLTIYMTFSPFIHTLLRWLLYWYCINYQARHCGDTGMYWIRPFLWIRPCNVTPHPWLDIHPSCKRTSNWLQRGVCSPAGCCVRVAVFTELVLALEAHRLPVLQHRQQCMWQCGRHKVKVTFVSSETVLNNRLTLCASRVSGARFQ